MICIGLCDPVSTCVAFCRLVCVMVCHLTRLVARRFHLDHVGLDRFDSNCSVLIKLLRAVSTRVMFASFRAMSIQLQVVSRRFELV